MRRYWSASRLPDILISDAGKNTRMKRRTFVKLSGLLTAGAVFALVVSAAVSCGWKSGRSGESQPRAEAAVEAPVAAEVPAPGDYVSEEYLAVHPYREFFTVQPIPDDIFELMKGRTYKEGCTVPRKDLRYILCLHKDAGGRSIVGEMVAGAAIADDLKDILLKLYEASYPIEKMRLPDYWDADDEMMMRENNSSCFNFRTVSGSAKLSRHSLGMAVDINPLYNPYVKVRSDGTVTVKPLTASEYADRAKDCDYKIVRGDLCWKLFTGKGFRWGGSWNSVKDYQHFEL